ncbi:MAG TPA: phenylalanine--tRNA ligase subunit beta, partial [Spirochaetales bacterium]|nr:phenylalanine--tRNA ligase subunit beta [Spirochaetales bacterium]
MPKIEVNESLFFELLGRSMDAKTLESTLTVAKAELDGWDQSSASAAERSIKIELNDTNRPDLWSTAGIARQLRVYLGGGIPSYPFFSREGQKQPSKYRAVVDSSVKDVRPYLACFVISGKAISDPILKDAIQTQEKLCSNFGRKRRSVSMGMYRIDLVQWPLSYRGADPDATKFVPLQMTESMSLRRILSEHPKGKEYGHIISGYKKFPVLVGADGGILSMAPIINSADIGAVQVGDKDILVEFTGTDLESVSLSASMVACDFHDAGYEIRPVTVDYPWETAFGRSITFPYYFQTPASVDSGKATKLLGLQLGPERVMAALARMGIQSESHG